MDELKQDTVCRARADAPCDVEERCDGQSPLCPANGYAGSDVTCRSAVDLCDRPEVCDGTTPDCPNDLPQPFGFVCRASASECDAAETCDGTSNECPADALKVDGAECDDADACSVSSVCLEGECVGARSTCNCLVDADCNGADKTFFAPRFIHRFFFFLFLCTDNNDCTSDACVDRECIYEFSEPVRVRPGASVLCVCVCVANDAATTGLALQRRRRMLDWRPLF